MRVSHLIIILVVFLIPNGFTPPSEASSERSLEEPVSRQTPATSASTQQPDGLRPPYNIVLISLDALNLEHMSAYGYPRETTPNMKKFGHGAITFTNMISPAGWTVPSYASLFTGQFQLTHGVDREMDTVPESALLLTEVLKEAGYRTAMFTGRGWLMPRFGVDQGFDEYNLFRKRYSREKYVAAANWLWQNKEEPFFLFFYSNDVHLPYRAVSPEKNPFVGDEYFDPIGPIPVRDPYVNPPEVREEANGGIMPRMLLDGELTEKDTIGLYIAQYDAGLRFADENLRFLIQVLKARDLMENTIIIFTSDHGQSMTQHERYFEHSSFFENIIRVPFIIRVPGLEKGTIEAQAQLVDVAPTLLDLNHLPIPDRMTGRSFAPLLRREVEDYRDATYVFGDIWGVIRTPEWKLVLEISGASGDGPTPGRRMARNYLYHLAEDPEELTNLYDSEDPAIQAVIDDLRERLYAFMAEHRSGSLTYVPRGETVERDAGENPVHQEIVDMDEETRELLHSLGYLQN